MMNSVAHSFHIEHKRSHLALHIADQVIVVAELEARLEHDLHIH